MGKRISLGESGPVVGLVLWLGILLGTGLPNATAATKACDNFYPPDAPIYSGSPAGSDAFESHHRRTGEPKRVLRFISYNIRYGHKIGELIQDLRHLDETAPVDFIFLQEVNGTLDGSTSTAQVLAETLGMHYVYAPAMNRRGHDYGNAILSRWPLEKAHKIVVPRSKWEDCNLRAPVGAQARVAGQLIQLYSIHLSTIFPDSIGPERLRAKQVAPVVDEAKLLPPGIPILAAGDFNSLNPHGWTRVRKLFFSAGFINAHPSQGWTFKMPRFDLDHAFARGMQSLSSGTYRGAKGSDHVPIWGELALK